MIAVNDTYDIAYRPRGGPSRGLRVGAHASTGIGTMGAFRDQVPFLVHPDTRRIDVRATLRDPFEVTFVRRSRERISIDLYAVVDLTASMRYRGRARKRDLIAELCVALARSATRNGDRFGLIGCGTDVRDDCFIPASKRRSVATEVAARLDAASCNDESAEGLSVVAERLLGTRKMVFLISDFLLPPPLLRSTFESLARHDVVPVVIGDTSEDVELPEWGFLELTDLETGRRSLNFMRPSLKRRWLDAEHARRTEIRQLARGFGRTPVVVTNNLDIDAFSRHLMES